MNKLVNAITAVIFVIIMGILTVAVIGSFHPNLSTYWCTPIVLFWTIFYEWFLWYFRIRLYIVVDGIEKFVIRGIDRR